MNKAIHKELKRAKNALSHGGRIDAEANAILPASRGPWYRLSGHRLRVPLSTRAILAMLRKEIIRPRKHRREVRANQIGRKRR